MNARTGFNAASSTVMHDATQMLKTEMISLVPKYENETNRSITKKVIVGSGEVEGRVGPGVSPSMPKHAVVVEGGRRVGARIQPFGVNSKLYQWVQVRTGGDVGDARRIASAISQRGLPYRGNPRTPNPAPVFVERAYIKKLKDLDESISQLGADFTAELTRGWVDFGTP